MSRLARLHAMVETPDPETDIPELIQSIGVLSRDRTLRQVSVHAVSRESAIAPAAVVAALHATGKAYVAHNRAVGDMALLLTWVNTVVAIVVEKGLSEGPDTPSDLDGLLAVEAALLMRCVSTPSSKPPMKRQAERQVRTALTQALRSAPALVDRYLALLPTLEGLAIVSVLTGAAADISGDSPEAGDRLSSAENQIVTAYCQAVLGTKPADAVPVLPLFDTLFVDLIGQKSLDAVIVPSLQKAVLRSPEVLLQSTLPALVKARGTLDMATAVKSLSPSLASNLSSSNASLRQATATVWRDLLAAAGPDPAVDDLLRVLSKATNSEQRQLAATALMGAPTTVGADALASAAARDVSEAGVRALARALAPRLESPVALKAFETGLNDTRPLLRREWACALPGHSVPEQLVAPLSALWTQVTQNIGAAVTSKLIAAAWAVVLVPEARIQAIPAIFEPRTWAQGPPELLAEAAAATAERLNAEWAFPALVHVATSLSISPQIRLEASGLAKRATTGSEALQLALAPAIEQAIAANPRVRVVSLMGAFRTPKALVRALVVAHEPQAQFKGGWIALCLGAGVDPGNLVTDQAEALVNDITARGTPAARETLATMAFVAPTAVAPLLAAYLERELRPMVLDSADERLLATPEGQLVSPATVGPRPGKHNASQAMSDEAWEAQVRAEVAAKKGKLTREDQALLESQTERRRELRAREAAIDAAAATAAVLAHHTASPVVAAGALVDTGALGWFPQAASLLVPVARGGLGSKTACDALEALSACLSPRFANKRDVARLLLKPELPLTLRVLYGVNALGDSRPLDALSVSYLLPVLNHVLELVPGRDGDEDAVEEAQLLALALLANQADVLNVVPRPGLITALLKLLGGASDKGAVQDCLLRVAQGVSFDSDELQQLLDAVMGPVEHVRTSVLDVLDAEVDLSELGYAPEIDVVRHAPEHAHVASEIWDDAGMVLPSGVGALERLEPLLDRPVVQPWVALAYRDAAKTLGLVSEAVSRLTELYYVKKQPPAPKFDEFGLPIKQHHVDPVPLRRGLLAALDALVPLMEPDTVLKTADFVVADAVTDAPLAPEALGLGRRLVDVHGAAQLDGLLPRFAGRHVVLYGWEAQHLPSGDSRLGDTVAELLASLEREGEPETAVVDCLGPLACRIDATPVIDRLVLQLSDPEPIKRVAAAHGIAGLVGGLGLVAVGDAGVVRYVEAAGDDRRDAGRRHGAQLLVSALARRLGRRFEPYALELMPQVLAGLGDSQPLVRDAATDAARAIMQHTTAFGVQRQIPRALRQLDTPQWRGKKGAVELLGAMAWLDPRQLAVSLNIVVPELVGVLNDTHREVRAAGKAALRAFGDVISNPEVRVLVPVLLDAIGDPVAHTERALGALLRTRFVHYVDSPSLALVICVVQRGLRDRSAATKRQACQIVGNMSILAASSDLVPYLPGLMPDLETAMTDPVPQTCATACKALGVLVHKLGEHQFPGVVDRMLATLATPERAADRWGTAQGLAEVLHGLGIARLEAELPRVLSGLNSAQAAVRQGFAPLLLLLPSSFGASIAPYLPQLVTPLLRGLADTLEDVRDTALKAGRRIVRGFASASVALLLPELERGLGDASWRVRLASVELVGDLLLQLLGRGRDAKPEIAEAPPTESGEVASEAVENIDAIEASKAAEDAFEESAATSGAAAATEASVYNPLAVLQLERSDRLLANLFVCRADAVPAVRQAGLETWMALVPNTPRAVKAILPALVPVVVRRLGDEDSELRLNASRALADLARRVPGALAAVLPLLESLAADSEARIGVCAGLGELIPAAPADLVREHHGQLAQLVRLGLTDASPATREAASKALDALSAALGDAAGDLLPGLVAQAAQGDTGALQALRDMPGAFARAVPVFLEPPVTLPKARGLADLSQTAGSDVYSYVDSVADALLPLTVVSDSPEEYAMALDDVLRVHTPEAHLLSIAKRDNTLRRAVLDRMSAWYASGATVDTLFAQDWLSLALGVLDEDAETAHSAAKMVESLARACSKTQLAQLASPAYHALQLAHVSGTAPINGFAEVGPRFVLPFFVQGLVAGSAIEKEHGALGLTEVVRRAPNDALKPVVTQIAGPLIRVVGERSGADVKAAVLYTLHELLAAVPAFLRPFLPQLQRTFVKNLADSTPAVRTRAAQALGELIKHQPRVDPLARELVAGVRASEDSGVTHATLTALLEVVRRTGSSLSEPVRESVVDLAVGTPPQGHEALVARLAASLAATEPSIASDLVRDPENIASVYATHALWMYATSVAMTMAGDLIQLASSAAMRSLPVFSEPGIKAVSAALLKGAMSDGGSGGSDVWSQAVDTLVRCVHKGDRSSDTRRLALVVLSAIARHHRELVAPHLDDLVVPLFSAARDSVIPVKLAAERAFLYIFDLVGRQDAVLFDEWFTRCRDSVPQPTQRSLPEWVRRVALRHAAREAEAEHTSADDDLDEIWTI